MVSTQHGYVTDRAGIEPRVARSRVQRLNHWAIKVPERPSRLRLAGSLHYSPLFEIRAPWLGPLSTKAGSFHSQANPGYHCHQCNGPCGYRTPGRSLQSPTPKPLGHKGTWTTQSLTLGWFVTVTIKQSVATVVNFVVKSDAVSPIFTKCNLLKAIITLRRGFHATITLYLITYCVSWFPGINKHSFLSIMRALRASGSTDVHWIESGKPSTSKCVC